MHRHICWDGFPLHFFILLNFCVEHSGGRKSKEIPAGWAAVLQKCGLLEQRHMPRSPWKIKSINPGRCTPPHVRSHKLFLECVSVNIPAEFPLGLCQYYTYSKRLMHIFCTQVLHIYTRSNLRNSFFPVRVI